MFSKFGFIVLLMAAMPYHAFSMSEEKVSFREERRLSAWHEMVIGMLAGGAEVVPVGNTLNVVKTHLQLREPWLHGPMHYTRGMGVNVLGMVPITALQFGVNQWLKDILTDKGAKSLSASKEAFAGLFSGVLAAGVACPMDYVATQQRTGDRLVPTIKRLMAGKHMVWHGFWPVAVRDGLFSAGFMVVAPYLKREFQEHGMGPVAASLAAGGVAGVATALASHPMDVIRARMHGHQSPAVIDAVKALYREGGVVSYFLGAGPRSLRVMWAVTALAGIPDWLREKKVVESAADQLSDLLGKCRI